MVNQPMRAVAPSVVAAAALVVASVIGFAGSATALPSALVVGTGSGDYATIGAAVAAASAGDSIEITAGTYPENVTVPVALRLVGAGTGATKVIGTLTLDAPTDVSGLTLLGQASVPSSGGPDPLSLNAGSAGSTIHDNVIGNGNDAVYASGVTGSASTVTVIQHNTINDFHGAQGNGVWIWQSSYFDVDDNTISDGTPIDDNSAGINLGCGSSTITIDGNTLKQLDNAVVDISTGTPACAASTDVAITNNTVTDTDSSPLYFGGNNIADVTISANTISTAGGVGGGIVISGYDGWLQAGGAPISGFVVNRNRISDAPNGLWIGADSELGGPNSVTSSDNTYCSSGLAIDNQTGVSVSSHDDNLCGTSVSPGVVVTVTPPSKGGSTSGIKPSGGGATGTADVATASTTSVDPSGTLAVTGNGSTSGSTPSSGTAPTKTKNVKTAVQTASTTLPLWLIVPLALVVVLMLFFLVFVVARRRGDA